MCYNNCKYTKRREYNNFLGRINIILLFKKGESFMKIFKVLVSSILILSMTTISTFAIPRSVQLGKIYEPKEGESYFIGSSWAISTNNSLGISWYENPIEDATRWEAFIIPLRVIKSACKRLNTPIVLKEEDVTFKWIGSFDKELVEDINIMIKIGVLSSTSESNFRFYDLVTRAEAAKIISKYNDYYFKIKEKRNLIKFSDIDNHWALPYINKVYTSKIINGNSDGTFNPNGNITKEQLVQTLYNCIELSSITLEDVNKGLSETYNVGPIINKNIQEPSNRWQYPYLMSNVEKRIYERPYIISRESYFENPNFVYYDLKDEIYDRTKRVLEQHYNLFINVDYSTIEEDKYHRYMQSSTAYSLPKQGLSKYIQYLKDNKVVIKGKAIFQAPIIYYDGAVYRIRMKLDLNIESQGEYKNLMYLDSESNNVTTYKPGNNVIYIDAPAAGAIGTDVIYPIPMPLFSILTPE
jgi:hypothetical protein